MMDVVPVVALPKKKRSKVSVSNSISQPTLLTHKMLLEMAACCLEGMLLPIVLGRNNLFHREKGLLGCKGLPRLSSMWHHASSCSQIPLLRVFHF